MSHRFYLFLIASALCVPNAYAMKTGLLKVRMDSNSFTENGKEYMKQQVRLWVQASQESNITTGLAEIFSAIEKAGIEYLLADDACLESAQLGFNKIYTNPEFLKLGKTCKAMDASCGENSEVNKNKQKEITIKTMGKVWVSIFAEWCPDLKLSDDNLERALFSGESESVSDRIEILKLNQEMNVDANIRYIGAFLLNRGHGVSRMG